MNDSRAYRVFKLRSGDTIIARIVGEQGNKLILERPMKMQKLAWFDQQGIPRKELLALNNWIEFTLSNQISLPKDFILGILAPAPQLIKIYDASKEREDQVDSSNLNFQVEEDNNNGDQVLPFEEPEHRDGQEIITGIIESILENMGIDIDYDEEVDEEGAHDVLDEEDPTDFGEGNRWQDWPDNIEDYFKE
jgi:hypothetical protein